MSFSPDGKTLASASSDKTIKLWNIKTKKEIFSFLGHNNAVNSVSFSPDGKILASGSDDNTIKLWNIETKKEILSFLGHNNAVNSVSFSPDGKTLASASSDNTIKLWNITDLNLDSLIKSNCDWVRGYLQNNPNVSQEDKRLCDRISSNL